MTNVTVEKSLVDEFLPLFQEIGAGAAARSEKRELPFGPINELKAAGFGALRVPVEYGGRGLDLPELFGLLIELASYDPQVAHSLRSHFGFIEDRLNTPSASTRAEWLHRAAQGILIGNATTESAPSPTGLSATLTREGDNWLLNGKKFYSTGSIFSDYIYGYAAKAGDQDMATFIVNVNQPGVHLVDDWNGFGQQLTGSGTTIFDNAAVPNENVEDLGTGFGEYLYADAYYQNVLYALQAGILRALVRDTASLVAQRRRVYSHGNGDVTREDPQILQVVGELAAAAHTAETLVLELARRMDQLHRVSLSGDRDAAQTLASRVQITAANTQTTITHSVLTASSRLFDALGASAVATDLSLDRHWRNARTIASHNPWIYKARIAGDWEVNGTEPPTFWIAKGGSEK